MKLILENILRLFIKNSVLLNVIYSFIEITNHRGMKNYLAEWTSHNGDLNVDLNNKIDYIMKHEYGPHRVQQKLK